MSCVVGCKWSSKTCECAAGNRHLIPMKTGVRGIMRLLKVLTYGKLDV
jgi:hypothetical protein